MVTSHIDGKAAQDQIFAHLLACAFSLQERHDHLRSRVSAEKCDELISAILDTERLVWGNTVHPETAMELIASRCQKLSGAAGTAIALLNGENLEYKIATGIATEMLGISILADASPSFQQLRSDSLVESTSWQDKAIGVRLVAASILSTPLRRHGKVAGCIQVFSRVGQFGEEATYTCELMASIASQLLDHIGWYEKHDTKSQTVNSAAPKLATKSSDVAAEAPISTGSSVQELCPIEPGNDSPSKVSTMLGNSRKRLVSVAYPFLVLIFVAFANVYGHTSWLLLLASIVIVGFTTLELYKRLRKQG
jgi:hypothetical protein